MSNIMLRVTNLVPFTTSFFTFRILNMRGKKLIGGQLENSKLIIMVWKVRL